MGKAKALKEGKNAKNAKSHFKARMEFLDKAANYLQAVTTAPVSVSVSAPTQAAGRDDQEFPDKEAEKHMVPEHTLNSSAKEAVKSETDIHSRQMSKKPLANISRVYISHMRGVSLKTLTRLPVPTKRSFCKRCETPLTSGVTCSQEIQNASRGRKKPWADVKVVRCLVCGTEKRFPETERKSKKLVERRQQKQEQEQKQMEAEVPIPAQAQLQSQTQTTQTQDATS